MKARGKVPMRQCTGCREMKSKKEMMRVLRTDTGEIILDTTGRKNGRGAYICFSMECLEIQRSIFRHIQELTVYSTLSRRSVISYVSVHCRSVLTLLSPFLVIKKQAVS